MIKCEEIRKKYTKLNCKQFAQEIGIPYTTYKSYEEGTTPSVVALIKISKFLNTPIDVLIDNSVTYTPKQQEAIKLILSLNDENLIKIIERASVLKEMELNHENK